MHSSVHRFQPSKIGSARGLVNLGWIDAAFRLRHCHYFWEVMVIVMYRKIAHVIRIWILPIGLKQRPRLTFCSLVQV